MLDAIALVMLIVGIQLVVTGKLPSIPFVRPNRRLGKRAIRLVGAMMMLPLPLSSLIRLLLARMMGDAGRNYDIALDLAMIVGAGIAILFIVRHTLRQRALSRPAGEGK